MDSDLQRLLETLAAEGRTHDAQEPVHARRRLNLETETAQHVAFLLKLRRTRRVLEVGTSNGYGTIWLAWAVAPCGGKVVTIERDAGKQAEAARNLERAGLRASVELIPGDATEAVRSLDGRFDAVVFDADRFSAPAQLELLRPKLESGALLLADNALSHPDEIAGYLRAVEALPDSMHHVVPVGKGLSVAMFRP